MIQVQNLDFTYKKTQKESIHQMNFDVQEGEVYGFLGPNGAGNHDSKAGNPDDSVYENYSP